MIFKIELWVKDHAYIFRQFVRVIRLHWDYKMLCQQKM